MLIIHEIPGDTPVLQGKQPAVLMPPRQVHIDKPVEGHLTAPLLRNGVIQRQHHRHMVAPGRQRHRQTPGYVRQAACFTEGGGLPRYIQNIHLTLHLRAFAQHQGVLLCTLQMHTRADPYRFIRNDAAHHGTLFHHGVFK